MAVRVREKEIHHARGQSLSSRRTAIGESVEGAELKITDKNADIALAEPYWKNLAVALTAIVVLALVLWGVLFLSQGAQRLLGPLGQKILLRFFGLILVAIGVQFILADAYEFFTCAMTEGLGIEESEVGLLVGIYALASAIAAIQRISARPPRTPAEITFVCFVAKPTPNPPSS